MSPPEICDLTRFWLSCLGPLNLLLPKLLIMQICFIVIVRNVVVYGAQNRSEVTYPHTISAYHH